MTEVTGRGLFIILITCGPMHNMSGFPLWKFVVINALRTVKPATAAMAAIFAILAILAAAAATTTALVRQTRADLFKAPCFYVVFEIYC